MNGNELIELFKKGGKRCHVIGTSENGVIAGLDLEGRLYAVMNGVVMNRVNPAAILGITTRSGYLNPGGDGLWPAPEGTCAGYQYGTGSWRVSPGLTGARFLVTEETAGRARIEAEIDLINASGLGIPAIFSRDVSVTAENNCLTVKVVESIQYVGARTFNRAECMLAPWTLCQFDCAPGCEVVFPATADADIWDLYDPSDDCRFVKDGLVHARTDASKRYQIGIGASVPWIKLCLPHKKLEIRRSAPKLPENLDYIDIADASPSSKPSDKETRYSVYSDMNGFMEIEAVGGCPRVIESGMVLSVEVTTEYRKSI
ncbi:MAG: hypothetical protein ACYC4Q_00200 [Victivallaceae bacterium]